jgi:biotin carboxyl carrier protein
MSARVFETRGVEVSVDAQRRADQLVAETEDGTLVWPVTRVGSAEFIARTGDEDGHTHAIHAIREGSTWWVHVDGRTYRFEAVVARGGGPARDGGSLAAPIPATVVEVLVRNGDTVESDQLLLVLSAMKMQLEVKAPHAGTVTGLVAAADDSVDGGQQLLTIVPPETAAENEKEVTT